MSAAPSTWEVAGSYFEACNCEAICPCRRVGSKPGGRSTYGVCQFALSWQILDGHADAVPLRGLGVVLAGWYDDDVPESPWSVSLYVDERSSADQFDALADIFLGRAGGGTFEQFAAVIGTVHHVRRATISLTHQPRRWRIRADTYVSVTAARPVDTDEAVTCGIPGHDRPGTEVFSDQMRVDDDELHWDLHERCGFASDFRYTSS